ncbi:HAMP domain-containing histidine kinase [Thermomonas sp. S9]|uniref:sensor histidine kinase n=1 Tax=Thermomonas sp. S9 TaxID=2885203 RepID=UPI00216AD216|nr:HAMP domain-containing sensor histidine kinase [Thermomonas sp. S9]MCR6497007.1 HAMP domain-containing histidine kinase [Thermomonas sp. S9]
MSDTRLLPRSAARRIALVGLLIYALALLPLGAAIYYATHAALRRQIEANLVQLSDTLQTDYRNDGARGLLQMMARLHGSGPIPQGAALFAPDGRRLGGNIDTTLPAASGWQRILLRDPREGPDPALALVRVLPDGNRLVVAADLEALEAIGRTLLGMFALAALALLVLGALAAWALTRYLGHRLAPIQATADAVMRGQLEQRARVGAGGDEFDRVAASLNAMLDRIAALVDHLRQVSADLAHDLRTPLMRLRNQLETLPQEADPERRQALLAAAQARTDEVLGLFDAILRIAEVDAGELARGFGVLDLSALLNDLAESLQPLAEDTGHPFSYAIAPGLTVHGDRQLLAQAVLNLVENALRHTSPGCRVELRAGIAADAGSGAIVICVRDDGPGIPAVDRERVRQRFVRLEASRHTPGHGLGLSLVEAIAQAHAGRLQLEDAAPGLRACLVLPPPHDAMEPRP